MDRPRLEAMVDEVSKALALVNKCCRNPRPITGELTVLWATVLIEHKVEPQDVGPATTRLLGEEPFFPSPADLVRCAGPAIIERKSRRELEWSAMASRRLPSSPEQAEREREACRRERNERQGKGGLFAQAISAEISALKERPKTP